MAGPKRFLVARSVRCGWVTPPANSRTTSTRCSSDFGPATRPSLVTWPTSTTGGPPRLARSRSCEATSRTCVTLPGTAGTRSDSIVCTESAITNSGFSAAAVATAASTTGSASRSTRSLTQPRRWARKRDLAPGLLGADVQDRSTLADQGRDLEQQRRLADPRLAGEEEDRAGDQAAAEHAVEAGNPGRGARGVRQLGGRERHRHGGRRALAGPGPLGDLLEGVPPSATRTPAEPLAGALAAGGALEGGGLAPHR